MGRVKSPSEEISVDDAFSQIRAGIRKQAVSPNIFAYKPHPKQKKFHKAQQKRKLFIGGNRSGKTLASIAEDIWWCTETHPFRVTPPAPIRGRVVAVDFLEGLGQIILPLFERMCPPSQLKGGSWESAYNKQARVLTFDNDSTIEFMSYEQDLEKFAGTSRHFIHFDEEPPKHIFTECGARLIDTGGTWWISMTPVDGMTWTYESIFEPGQDDPKTFVIEVEMLDNPAISKEAAEDYLSTLDPGEREAREKGHYVQLGGRVYKTFTETGPNVIEPINVQDYIKLGWRVECSMDHGFRNPAAWLWHVVSPTGEIITFDEYVASEQTVQQVATTWHEKNTALGIQPNFNVGDPAIAQRSGINGNSIQVEYAVNGVYIALGNNDVPLGVAKVNSYIRLNPATGTPTWRVTRNCGILIRELLKLRWATYSSRKLQYENNPQEKIHKKDDHASDALRYKLAFMPDLAFDIPVNLAPDRREVNSYLNAKVGAPAGGGGIDSVLEAMGMFEGGKQLPPEQRWKKLSQGTDIGALEYE